MTEPLKQCIRCALYKPATTIFFYRDKYKKDGMESYCKECRSAMHGTEHRKPAPPAPDGHKWCRQCEQIKPLNEFHKKKTSVDGKRETCIECRARNEGFKYKKRVPDGYRRCSRCKNELPATDEYFYVDKQRGNFHSTCKTCVNDQLRQWAKENPDKEKESQRKYTETNREKIRSKNRIYAQNNKEKRREYYLRNIKRHIERGRQWYWKNIDKARSLAREKTRRWFRNNPVAAKAVVQRRAARKRSLPDTLTAAQWQRCLEYWGHRCAYCGRDADLFTVISLDHFIPLSSPDCPGTTVLNSLPACHKGGGCNSSKSDKPAAEWLESKFGPRKAKQILKRIATYFDHVRQQPD